MSLWGATVITSLASALPIVGTSIVGWLWGGFSVLCWRLGFKICYLDLDLDLALENPALCGNNFFMGGYLPLGTITWPCLWATAAWAVPFFIGKVKMPLIHSQSAGVWAFSFSAQEYKGFSGKSNPKKPEVSLEKKEKAPAPQRLNAGKYAWLVGFIEADGWFGVFKNGKYIQYEMGLELHKRDTALLHQLKHTFKLSGTVRTRKDRPDMVVLKVRQKKDLIEKILPIFDAYPMIGPKVKDYQWLKFHLVENKTVYSKDLDKFSYEEITSYVEQTPQELSKIPYFNHWLVGFVNGEGCFCVYTPSRFKGTNYFVCSFDVSQKEGGFLMLEAIAFYLKLNTKVHMDKENLCFKLKVSTLSSISKVYKFFSKSPLKLKGYKHVQYVQWTKSLKKSVLYGKLFNFS